MIAPEAGDVRIHVDAVEVFDAVEVEDLTLDVDTSVLVPGAEVTTTDVVDVLEAVVVADEIQEHPLESFDVFDLQADAQVGSEVVCV
jgi:hypothetical protein